MSALSTVILAGLLIGRFNGLDYFAVQTLWAGLPHFVCGLAVSGRHCSVGVVVALHVIWRERINDSHLRAAPRSSGLGEDKNLR